MTRSRNPKVHALYLPHVETARARVREDATLAALLDPSAEDPLVLGFLIYFSALGVQMTRPVEDWIRRAGERCVELGHAQLGRALVMHARHEADHHLMMLEDLRKLVPRWNQTREPTLELDELLALAPTPAMQRYVEIHEQTIAGSMPYGQIAIEYEVEGMSTVLGPALMDACRRALGEEILAGMSFISEHAAIDVGHTAMNEAELEKFLTEHPEQAEALARVGGQALNIYLDFLGDCVRMARALLEPRAA